MKCCNQCKESKNFDDFYICGRNKQGGVRYNPKCKECVLENNRLKYNSDPKYSEERKLRAAKNRENPEFVVMNKKRGENFYYSLEGRAKTLLKSAQRRKYKGTEFDLDLSFIVEKLEKGVCEVTGIQFSYEKPSETFKNKFSPSIDRIDSSLGYTKDNVRLVIWQYNLMKGEISDSELLEICKILVEGR